jgi:hypothetical protein
LAPATDAGPVAATAELAELAGLVAAAAPAAETVVVDVELDPQPQMSPAPAKPRASHVDSALITFPFYHRLYQRT